MIALLDVNVLVALFDPTHTHHESAHRWFGEYRSQGWATCPLTENGLIRVLSHVRYPGRGTTVEDAIGRLRLFRESGGHEFWPDSVSLADGSSVRPRRISGAKSLTDVYLLALAVRNGGRLASFDRSIPLSGVSGAAPESLVLLGG